MSSDHLGHIEKVQPKKMPQKSLTFSLTSKVPLRTQAHCESLMLTRAQYVPHAHNARAGLREDQSQESPPSPKAFGVSQPSPRPQESPTLAQSLRSLHTITATARVPHSRPKPSESPHHHRDRKSPHSRPRKIRGCAVMSLTHVYKPLVGLYACGRANRKKALLLETPCNSVSNSKAFINGRCLPTSEKGMFLYNSPFLCSHM